MLRWKIGTAFPAPTAERGPTRITARVAPPAIAHSVTAALRRATTVATHCAVNARVSAAAVTTSTAATV